MPSITDEQMDFERLVPDRASPGQMLKMAREMRKLSPTDIAKQLNLRVQWIIDIENDHYNDAVALIYVKGYLKSYARLVGISSDEVLAAFKGMKFEESFLKRKPTVGLETPKRHQPVLSSRELVASKGKSKRWKIYLGVAMLFVVVAVLLAWLGGVRAGHFMGKESTHFSESSQPPVALKGMVVNPVKPLTNSRSPLD